MMPNALTNPTGSSYRVILSGLILVVTILYGCEDRRADRAYLRGDYKKSVEELQALANLGDSRAEYDLGVIYDQGIGVPQSDAQAFLWYSRAAEHGEPKAQYNLGLMYLNGQGMQPNFVLAYYWLSLALAKGEPKAPAAREYLADKMTSAEIQEANRLVQVRLTTGDGPDTSVRFHGTP